MVGTKDFCSGSFSGSVQGNFPINRERWMNADLESQLAKIAGFGR